MSGRKNSGVNVSPEIAKLHRQQNAAKARAAWAEKRRNEIDPAVAADRAEKARIKEEQKAEKARIKAEKAAAKKEAARKAYAIKEEHDYARKNHLQQHFKTANWGMYKMDYRFATMNREQRRKAEREFRREAKKAAKLEAKRNKELTAERGERAESYFNLNDKKTLKEFKALSNSGKDVWTSPELRKQVVRDYNRENRNVLSDAKAMKEFDKLFNEFNARHSRFYTDIDDAILADKRYNQAFGEFGHIEMSKRQQQKAINDILGKTADQKAIDDLLNGKLDRVKDDGTVSSEPTKTEMKLARENEELDYKIQDYILKKLDRVGFQDLLAAAKSHYEVMYVSGGNPDEALRELNSYSGTNIDWNKVLHSSNDDMVKILMGYIGLNLDVDTEIGYNDKYNSGAKQQIDDIINQMEKELKDFAPSETYRVGNGSSQDAIFVEDHAPGSSDPTDINLHTEAGTRITFDNLADEINYYLETVYSRYQGANGEYANELVPMITEMLGEDTPHIFAANENNEYFSIDSSWDGRLSTLFGHIHFKMVPDNDDMRKYVNRIRDLDWSTEEKYEAWKEKIRKKIYEGNTKDKSFNVDDPAMAAILYNIMKQSSSWNIASKDEFDSNQVKKNWTALWNKTKEVLELTTNDDTSILDSLIQMIKAEDDLDEIIKTVDEKIYEKLKEK